MPDTLFISYKSEENPFALQLAAGLKNHGVNVWIDRMDIQTGDNWVDSIGAALRNCSGMIAILTPDYFRSPVCLDELNFAYAEKRPILPLLLRNIFDERDADIQAKIPFWLPRRQWLDFTDFLDDAAFQRQFDILVTRIQAEQQGVVGDRPSAEIQYLTSLIADLESQQGVENYIALSAQSEIVRVDPRPRKNIEPSLALLLKPPTPERDVRPATKKIDNIQQAVADHPKFVLIGDPGAGKTTTLRRLALEMARARLEELTSPPGPLSTRREGEKTLLPFLVYLPRWSAEPTAADFIRRQWAATNMGGDVVRELQSGQVRLYLDGLNEMGGEGKKKAALLREWLQAANGPRYAIITCRQGDYHDDLKLGDLPTVLVEPLTDEKIREFAAQYLGEEQAGWFLEKVFPPKNVSFRERERVERRSLIHLARNPYLLAALTLIFESGGDLPPNTGALFQKLAMVLWERESLRQTQGWIPFEEMQAAFGNLAFSMIDEDQPIDVPLAYAEAKLGETDLLNIGRSANLITLNGGEMRFSHQLMLEYFAAAGLEEVGLENRLRRPVFHELLGRRATKWDEVVIASCGLVSEPASVVNRVVDIDPFLAADCLRSGIEVTRATHEKVITSLSAALHDADSDVRSAAADALGKIGTPAIPALLGALRDSSLRVHLRAIDALGKIGPSAIPALLEALRDSDRIVVHLGATAALGKIGTPAIPALLDALRDPAARIRYQAADALTEIGDPSTIPALLEALRNPAARIRYQAADALGKIGDPATVPDLIERLADTGKPPSLSSRCVCDAAAQALEKIGTPEALEAVCRFHVHNLQSGDNSRRRSAFIVLGRIGDSAAVPDLIEQLADTETLYGRRNQSVRDAAAEALEKIGTPEALEAVRRWREEQGKP